MTTVYKCTVCKEGFRTKAERDYHYRGECQMEISLTDSEGHIHNIERIDGTFSCPCCENKLKNADKIILHWKRCSKRDGTQSNYHY